MTKSERKNLRREEAIERATSRETFLNKNGREGYITLLKHLNVKFPNGAKKEKGKLNKMIAACKP